MYDVVLIVRGKKHIAKGLTKFERDGFEKYAREKDFGFYDLLDQLSFLEAAE